LVEFIGAEERARIRSLARLLEPLEECLNATLEDVCKVRSSFMDRMRGRVVAACICEDTSDVVEESLWCCVLEAAKMSLNGAEVRRLGTYTRVVRQIERDGVDRPHERVGRRLLDEVPQDCLEPIMDCAFILRPEAQATHKTPAALNERLEPRALVWPAFGVKP
jgi:hypothetical protein